jgi:hypothetical protein
MFRQAWRIERVERILQFQRISSVNGTTDKDTSERAKPCAALVRSSCVDGCLYDFTFCYNSGKGHPAISVVGMLVL